jgi:SAM-dependent methyltransferase
MSAREQVVDWYAYAQRYDLLLAYNPYYQEARRRILAEVARWSPGPGTVLADLGAGTGNYSAALARAHPETAVCHLENNRGMNAVALRKAAGLSNFRLLAHSVFEAPFEAASLDGVLCINALYTFPAPEAVLVTIFDWLRPGGRLVLLDPGRVMNLLAWKWAIFRHLAWTYGLRRTWQIVQEGKAVSRQNARIRALQRNGTYWLHSHAEFCEAVRMAGFEVYASDTCFRGDCDLVFARKPAN